ncbi:hypothetical protein QN277_026331 [Acacia crassicarpa]|uniref:BSD domain-containing protein n=1 Tax=Acacia crassicarpa TaxID=499986 RepID=A0AAE1MHP1_9FABA|nr:hypothetical protein QN277_026331 [Acacia crassicarpa]
MSSSSQERVFPGDDASPTTRPLESRPRGLVGVRNDLADIGECFKKAVSGLTEFASEMLQFEYDDDDEEEDKDQEVPGISDEVLRFVEEISERPYFWTDFPVLLDNDFSMTHTQRRHALAIEELVPEFLTLRLDLCSHMNVETFWLIYFLMLLPRLNQQDSELLLTSKIVELRSMILKNLEHKTTLEDDNPENLRNPSPHREDGNESLTEKDNISPDENQILDDEIISATECLGIDNDTQSCSAKWSEDTDFSHTLSQLKQEEEDDDNKSVISESREARDLTRVESRDGYSGWVKL